MATPGKKGKKQKGKTLSLNDFLSDGTTNEDGSKVVVAATTSWADEMDEYEESGHRSTEQFVLPTAPRAARGPDISDDRIPKNPPYTAYVANLSYDIDEEDVMKFFSKLKIKGVRLPRDDDSKTGRLKGFGYADFDDRESLIEALTMNDLLLKNRKVRVDLASHAGKGDRDHGGRDGGQGGNRGRYDDAGDDRTSGDWRSGPAPPPREDDRRRDRYEPPRDRDDRRENRGYGFDRERREGGGGGFDRDRREGGGFDRDRREGGGFDRDRREGGGFDRERREGGGFDRDRRDGGGFDRDRRDGGTFERRGNYDRKSPERDAPRERPKLQLAKRSVAPGEEESKEAPPAVAPVAQSSIFGGAKPVDTTRREKEIEEKLKKPENPTDRSPRESEGHSSRDEAHEDESHKEETRDEPEKSKPKAASIFGQAKPVDTTAREKEIEEKLKKKTGDEPEELENGERKNIHSGNNRNSEERRLDDRGPRRDAPRRDDHRDGPRRDDHRDGPRRDDHRDGPRRDDHRDGPRRDDYRDGPRRDDHRDGPRCDDHRDGPRHDDRGDRDGPRHDERDADVRGPKRDQPSGPPKHDRKLDRSTPPLKKFEEKSPPNFAGANKFSILPDSEEVGSGHESE